MYWYVLFVRTGKEHTVEKFLKERLDAEVFMPFVPLHERLFKMHGIIKKEIKPLFPGYVFIESEMSNQEFIRSTSKLINTSTNIVRIMRYTDTEIAIRESERLMLLSLFNDQHCIEASSGIIEGDKIIITEGPLKGFEGVIIKVNRHKRQAWMKMNFLGEHRLVCCALTIVDRL